MTQDLIPVRREDVEYFAELVRCRALSLPEPHKSQEREILTRLVAALNAPPSAEATRLYLPPDADAAHHALDSMYSESVTGDKYMEAYELVSHFIRAAGAPSLSETTKDQAQPDLALQERGQDHIADAGNMIASPQIQQSDENTDHRPLSEVIADIRAIPGLMDNLAKSEPDERFTQAQHFEGVDIPSDGITGIWHIADHWHDEEWEYTHQGNDLECLRDTFPDVGFGEIVTVYTLKKGPTLYAAHVPLSLDNTGDWDETEMRIFGSEADAKAAQNRLPSPPTKEDQ